MGKHHDGGRVQELWVDGKLIRNVPLHEVPIMPPAKELAFRDIAPVMLRMRFVGQRDASHRLTGSWGSPVLEPSDHRNVGYDSVTARYQWLEERTVDPAALSNLYGGGYFEGDACFAGLGDTIRFNFPEYNAHRAEASALFSSFPFPGIKEYLAGYRAVALANARIHWMPKGIGTRLYLRPICRCTTPGMGIQHGVNYEFSILCTAAGEYLGGRAPTVAYIETAKARVADSGCGAHKLIASYANMNPADTARKRDCDPVVFAYRGRFTECNSCNVFFLFMDNDRIVCYTPSLAHHDVLPGKIRLFTIEMLRNFGIKVIDDEDLMVDEVFSDRHGRLVGAFVTGTAVGIRSVVGFHLEGRHISVGDGKEYELIQWLRSNLDNLQYVNTASEDPRISIVEL